MLSIRRRRGITCAVLGMIPVFAPRASATDIHFDYTSFDNSNSPGANPHFGQAQFDVLNYPSIGGNYMMTSTDTHRPEMVANNNALAEFYNNFLVDYNAQVSGTGLDAAAEADAINAYVVKHSTSNGPRPSWLILNEISASTWPNTTQKGASYRAWVIAAVTRLHDIYGYDVVTYSPFANPSSFASDWQALAAKSYIGVENYLSGAGVMSHGTDYASRLAWAKAQYAWSKVAFGNVGVSSSRLFLGEDFSNTPAGTPYGRSGLSAADWDTVIQIRQDAIYQAGYTGFLAYAWGANEMGITEAEQLQHEYYYRSRLVLPGQQPQWLSDGQINLNGTLQPLSWNYALNWLGGVPNAAGAVANFYRTNTTARTVTLDGPMTVGTLTFNSPNSYTLAPGSGGSLALNNGSGLSSILVSSGAHTISSPLQITGAGATMSIASGTRLTISGALSGSSPLVKSDPGTLRLANSSNPYTGAVSINGGVLEVVSDTSLGAVPTTPAPAAVTLSGGTLRDVSSTAVIIPANRGITIGSGGGTLDFSSTSGVPQVSATFTGSGALTKTGYRTVLVNGNSGGSFSGNWIISQGRLNAQYNGLNPLGTGSITLAPGNGDVGQLGIGNGPGISVEIDNPIVLAPTGNGIASFEINGGNTLTLGGAISGSGALQKSGGSASGVQGGTPLVTAGAMILQGNNTYTGGTTVNSGLLVVSHDHALGTGGLTIASDATVALSPSLSKAVQLPSLSLAGNAQLDVNNNSLVLPYSGPSPINTVRSNLATGFNGGAWNGPGINSSAAANHPSQTTALAYAEASALGYTSFAGQTILGNAILVKYTYYGDVNFDGRVNADDYALLDRGFAKHLTGWTNGDFNYDGLIDASDYLLIDTTYCQAQGFSPGFLAMRESQFGASYVSELLTSIPEPSSILAACGLALPLLARRRA